MFDFGMIIGASIALVFLFAGAYGKGFIDGTVNGIRKIAAWIKGLFKK
jgi:hypothetical protein